MSRTSSVYSEGADGSQAVQGAASVSEPVAGFYRHRLRSGGVWGGVRIWFGPPHDPVTGEELDRSPRWQAEFNGEPIDLDLVWPACTGQPILETLYDHLTAQACWARANAPQSAWANPSKRVDLLDPRNPLPF